MSEFTLQCSGAKFRMTNSVFCHQVWNIYKYVFWPKPVKMSRVSGTPRNKYINTQICNPSRYIDFIFLHGRTDFSLILFPFPSVSFSPLETLISVEFMALCHLAPQVSKVQHGVTFIVWIAAVRFSISKYCRSNNAVTICLLAWSKWLHNQ